MLQGDNKDKLVFVLKHKEDSLDFEPLECIILESYPPNPDYRCWRYMVVKKEDYNKNKVTCNSFFMAYQEHCFLTKPIYKVIGNDVFGNIFGWEEN